MTLEDSDKLKHRKGHPLFQTVHTVNVIPSLNCLQMLLIHFAYFFKQTSRHWDLLREPTLLEILHLVQELQFQELELGMLLQVQGTTDIWTQGLRLRV